jgi:hypothetical protein
MEQPGLMVRESVQGSSAKKGRKRSMSISSDLNWSVGSKLTVVGGGDLGSGLVVVVGGPRT